jgi:excisionase family DNA binding protein
MSAAIRVPSRAPSPVITDVEACWTIEDVAKYLRAGRTTILLWVEQGKVPTPQKVGRRYLWDPAAIRSLVMRGGA